MGTFISTNKMPGVYIQEIQVPGPIAGVSTSIAAFIGPALDGPILQPTRVTNFTQYSNIFGTPDADGNMVPYFPNGESFAPFAVRGFYDNGGQTCYFVRVSRARRASLDLDDRAGAPQTALVVRALAEGVAGNSITVEVQDSAIATGINAVRETTALTSASGSQAVVPTTADADRFRPGDTVFLSEGPNSERAVIASISGTTLTLAAGLANTYTAAGTMRIADLALGQTRIRVDQATGVEPGSNIVITQGATTESGVVQAVDATNLFITLSAGLGTAFTMDAADPPVTLDTAEFSLVVDDGSGGVHTLSNLSMDPRHSRYVLTVARSTAGLPVDVALASPPTSSPAPDNTPAVSGPTALAGGTNENLPLIDGTDYAAALARLEEVDEVSILAAPDATGPAVQQALIDHCQDMADRFAVLDPPVNLDPNEITAHRGLLASDRGYGALYYPRIVVANPHGTPATITVPPSGHIAGLYARTDEQKGVHKAPANERLESALDLERTITDTDHGLLNEQGINVVRFFRGRGHRVWGARTIATGTQWRYVNVRRLLLFIEESIQEGTEFAVFEPNNEALWETVKRQVSGFLTRVWRSGALVGTKPEDAFQVKVDDELNTPETRALGQLIIEVRLAPTTPAEFIVFRIIQEPGKKLIAE